MNKQQSKTDEQNNRQTNRSMKTLTVQQLLFCMLCSQVVTMLLVILSIFTVCWLPLVISILYYEHSRQRTDSVSISVFTRSLLRF